MVDFDRARKMIERGTIEVAPLAFMRGRTLNDSFVILDEAQNTTREQMKMFLTRLGYGSKAVITGDVTQIDLPAGKALRAQGSAMSCSRDIAGHRVRAVQRARRRPPPPRAGHHHRVRARRGGGRATGGRGEWRSRCRERRGGPGSIGAGSRAEPRSSSRRSAIAPPSSRSFSLGDAAMRRLNRDYRGKDRTTDVLAFSLLEGAGAGVERRDRRRRDLDRDRGSPGARERAHASRGSRPAARPRHPPPRSATTTNDRRRRRGRCAGKKAFA